MIISKTPLRISFCGGGSDIPSFYSKHGGCVLSTTINKYITARRISIAKAVLNENGNVMEAFERSGFTDYSNFFKAFTKAVGISPKKYASLSVS